MSGNKAKVTKIETPAEPAAEEVKAVEVEPVEMRPAVDIIEGAEGVSLFFEVPGANAKSVEVEVDDGVLYVNAKSSLTRKGRPVVYKRAFYLSDAVNTAGITAKAADGLLTVWLPRTENARPLPRIIPETERGSVRKRRD